VFGGSNSHAGRASSGLQQTLVQHAKSVVQKSPPTKQ
jgi:hypothetical protein